MKFCWCTISVNDMEESLKFYQEIVGLKQNRRYPAGPDVEIAFLGEDETQVELISYGKGKVQMSEDISLGFIVESADQTMEFLKQKGIDIVGGPFKPNPHVQFFFIKDPNGVKIQFVEQIP